MWAEPPGTQADHRACTEKPRSRMKAADLEYGKSGKRGVSGQGIPENKQWAFSFMQAT